MASGAHRILEDVTVYVSVEAAIGDLNYVFATTARAHDQAKPVGGCGGRPRRSPRRKSRQARASALDVRARAQRAENHEVALADSIITLPVNPAFASLNLRRRS
jgi:tRNA/rRNA methyltransferase